MCQRVHIPDPDLRHIVRLSCRDGLEAIAACLESKRAVDSVTADYEAECAKDDDEHNDEERERVAGIIAGNEYGHGLYGQCRCWDFDTGWIVRRPSLKE